MKKTLLMTMLALASTLTVESEQSHLEVQVQNMPSNQNEGNDMEINQPGKPGNRSSMRNNPSQNYWGGTIENLDNPAYSQQNTQETPRQMVQQTLSIIKPDAVKNNHIGEIIARFEKAGLRIAAMKMTKLSKEEAGRFYQVHQGKPFYHALVDFMTSGPVVVMVLEGKQAITKNRELMGATDPSKAASGTLRADFAQDVTHNAVHGSDSPETAQQEISFFFKPSDIYKSN